MTRVFLVATELFLTGFLSRQGPSLCRDSVLCSVVTMSLQRVPCHSQGIRGKRSGCDRSLAEDKEFRVMTGNWLCRDKI